MNNQGIIGENGAENQEDEGDDNCFLQRCNTQETPCHHCRDNGGDQIPEMAPCAQPEDGLEEHGLVENASGVTSRIKQWKIKHGPDGIQQQDSQTILFQFGKRCFLFVCQKEKISRGHEKVRNRNPRQHTKAFIEPEIGCERLRMDGNDKQCANQLGDVNSRVFTLC